jgi:putative ABC transport system substrate-binding protein
MKRTGKIAVWLLTIVFLANIPLAEAQQTTKIPRIGFLQSSDSPFAIAAFRKGLRDLGYVEGENIVIEYRTAEAKQERIPGLVAELVHLKVDVLVSTAQPAIERAKQATKTIPIVMIATFDPVATGSIDTLARPGGNVTGVYTLQRELSGKRLELFAEVVPGISRVGILWDPNTPGPVISYKKYETAARALKIPLDSLEVRGPKPDFEGAFQAANKRRSSALIVIANSLMNRYQKSIADLAIKTRLPAMCERSDYVQAGGLASYAADAAERYRRAVVYVDRILKGAKPTDLPVEQPTKFEFVINLKTAKQIGLTIPPNVLARADRVIR